MSRPGRSWATMNSDEILKTMLDVKARFDARPFPTAIRMEPHTYGSFLAWCEVDLTPRPATLPSLKVEMDKDVPPLVARVVYSDGRTEDLSLGRSTTDGS